MSRFFWMIRREIWEHKAVWVAPAVVLGCIVLLMLTGRVHLGPYDGAGAGLSTRFTHEEQIALLMFAYSGLAVVVFLVMGVIAFCFIFQIAMANPDWAQVVKGFAPTTDVFTNPDMLSIGQQLIIPRGS